VLFQQHVNKQLCIIIIIIIIIIYIRRPDRTRRLTNKRTARIMIASHLYKQHIQPPLQAAHTATSTCSTYSHLYMQHIQPPLQAAHTATSTSSTYSHLYKQHIQPPAMGSFQHNLNESLLTNIRSLFVPPVASQAGYQTLDHPAHIVVTTQSQLLPGPYTQSRDTSRRCAADLNKAL
jgi:hypothetical protein